MNLKSAIGALIQVLTVVSTLTKSTIDDTILGLLKALYASDAFLAVLQSWIDQHDATTTMPPSALPMIDASDPAFATAFNASPSLQAWSASQKSPAVPEGAEPIGIGTVLLVMKYLPTIIALFKAWRSGASGK